MFLQSLFAVSRMFLCLFLFVDEVMNLFVSSYCVSFYVEGVVDVIVVL